MKISRRNFIISAASFSFLSFLGASTTYYYSREKRLINHILDNQFPDVLIDETLRDDFSKHFIEKGELNTVSTLKYSLRMILKSIKMETFIPSSPWLDRLERNLVTDFIKTTDFLELEDPTQQSPTFTGDYVACTNQFARFD